MPRSALLLSGMAGEESPLVAQARQVASLVEVAVDDDLDALCIACDAAERLAHRLGQKIQEVVKREDREAKGIASCKMNRHHPCQGG